MSNEDKGRPVKPHRSGGGYPRRSLKDVVASVPLPRYHPKMTCCANGERLGVEVCDACAEICAGYQAEMGPEREEAK